MIGGVRKKIWQCHSREKEGKGSNVVPSTPNGGGEGKEEEVVRVFNFYYFLSFQSIKTILKIAFIVSLVTLFLIPLQIMSPHRIWIRQHESYDAEILWQKNHFDEAALVLIRHGESLWNEKNLFTGCLDVPLTKKGVEEAIEAGKRISNIPVDMICTSALMREQMSAMLARTEHCRKKVVL